MAIDGFSPAKLKQQIALVRRLQGQPWAVVEVSPEFQAALAELVELFGPELGLTTSYEFFLSLQDPKQQLTQTLTIFEESETLTEYAQKTDINNFQIATLAHEYREYLAQHANDQLKNTRKSTQEWVKEILNKRRMTPAQLAAAVAARFAKEQRQATPSQPQVEQALAAAQASIEKTLAVSSRQGIAPIESFAEKALTQVETVNKVHLTETEHRNALSLIVAGLMVGAIPLSLKPLEESLLEEEADQLQRNLAQTTQKLNELKAALMAEVRPEATVTQKSADISRLLSSKEVQTEIKALAQEAGLDPNQVEAVLADTSIAGFKPNQLEQLAARNTTAELVHAVLSETTTKKLPETKEIRESLNQIPNFDDLAEKAEKTNLDTHTTLVRHQAYFLPPATSGVSDERIESLVKSYQQSLPDAAPVAIFATYPAAQVAAVVGKHDGDKGFGQAVELKSRGLDFKRAIAYAKANPNTPIGQEMRYHSQVFKQLQKNFEAIERSGPLNRDLTPLTLSPLQTRVLRLSNQLTFFVPPRFARPIQIFTNPLGWAQQTLGRRAGSYLAGQLGRSAALTSVKAAVLKLGVKTGLASLASKAGLALAKLGSGPVGWAVAAIQAAIDIGNVIFKPLMDFIGAESFGQFLRDSTVGALVLLASLPIIIATTISLTSLVPMAFIGIIGAILFIYIPTINIAPILSTMVQLETAPSTFATLQPGDILPPGEIPNSCPGGYPSALQKVAQGPGVGTHSFSMWRYSVNLREAGRFDFQEQAVDFGGGPTTVWTTHDGQAYAFPIGTPGLLGFGNFVVVLAECEGVQFITAYAHLSSHVLPLGGPTTVTKGQTIGVSGNTGPPGKTSDGLHLHYEIMAKGSPFNIVSWIAR